MADPRFKNLEIKVGLFVVIAIVIIIALIIAIGISRDIFTTKGLRIDFSKRQVTIDWREVHLTQIEFKIVSLLAKSAGQVLTYDFIITELWGPYAVKDNQILRVNMANIRRKLEKNPGSPEYIFTEVGIGYRMVDDGI